MNYCDKCANEVHTEDIIYYTCIGCNITIQGSSTSEDKFCIDCAKGLDCCASCGVQIEEK